VRTESNAIDPTTVKDIERTLSRSPVLWSDHPASPEGVARGDAGLMPGGGGGIMAKPSTERSP
jgi:hypothetical protein